MKTARERSDVLLLACLVCLPASAGAGPTPAVGARESSAVPPPATLVLPLVSREPAALIRFDVHGTRDADRAMEADVRRALDRKLTLAPTERVDAALHDDPRLVHCDEPVCAGKLGRTVGARWLLRGRADFDGANYRLELSALDAKGELPAMAQHDTCELCGWAEAREKAAALAGHLADALPEAPARSATPDGSKRAVLAHGDDASSARRVRPLAVGKWVALAAAAGLLATGIVMLAFDGQDTCTPAPLTQCPHYYSTGVEGGLFLGAGALATAAAATLFVLDHRQARSLSPALAPVNKGAVAGVLLRF